MVEQSQLKPQYQMSEDLAARPSMVKSASEPSRKEAKGRLTGLYGTFGDEAAYFR